MCKFLALIDDHLPISAVKLTSIVVLFACICTYDALSTHPRG